ncbi:hypothetical protein [Rubrivirga sp.]|uniref:hypothetical protein n=1 Tax=Rubrivirga sp. TaxID=1885344 RepID=UPI003B51F120
MPRTLSTDELARRGDRIYRSRVAPTLGVSDEGRFVMIDVDSEDFEIGADELEAAARLKRRRPRAQVWFRRVGAGAVRRYGRRHPR